MRHGVVILPEHRWPGAARVWLEAERLGFDHAWTYDHLMWRWLRDEPWFASVPTLAAAAAVTSRIRLGTMVAAPGFRHPVLFAKELMALDDISDGRLIGGVGAGAGGYDDQALGAVALPPRDRARDSLSSWSSRTFSCAVTLTHTKGSTLRRGMCACGPVASRCHACPWLSRPPVPGGCVWPRDTLTSGSLWGNPVSSNHVPLSGPCPC